MKIMSWFVTIQFPDLQVSFTLICAVLGAIVCFIYTQWKTIQMLQQENALLKEENADTGELLHEICELEEENAKLKDENAKLEENVSTQRDTMSRLTDTMTECELEQASLKEIVSCLNADTGELLHEIYELEEENEFLRNFRNEDRRGLENTIVIMVAVRGQLRDS